MDSSTFPPGRVWGSSWMKTRSPTRSITTGATAKPTTRTTAASWTGEPLVNPTMKRRSFLEQLSCGTALAGLLGSSGRALGAGADAQAATPAPTAGRSPLKITKVRAILTAPARIRLCVVKVETSEPGLYGLGCATFTQRIRTVVTAVNEDLAPFLAGKDPDHIEGLWPGGDQSASWRNRPVSHAGTSGRGSAP